MSLFFRRPVAGGQYSIERLFGAVSEALPADRFEIQHLVCPFESKGLLPRLAAILWAAIHQGDINHITGDVNFLGLLMRKSRTILTIHDSASMIRLKNWRRSLYLLVWLRLPIRRAGRVTAISERTLAETLSYVNADRSKFIVIPNCVTMNINLSTREFVEKRPRLLAIGTKPNKNLPRVMEALQGIPCQLVIVGVLSDLHRALIDRFKLDVEHHVGLDDNAIEHQYQDADLVLFVSTYEGFGLPILEAQAAGKPLITSKRAPMQSVAGPGSCLVDPDSTGEIREAILRVLNDHTYRAALVRAGTENVRDYSQVAIAARYAEVYEDMYLGKMP